MIGVGLFVGLEAKPGKEEAVAHFLEGALPLVQQEPQTTAWFALRLAPSRFAIFDTFPDEAGRDAHLAGQVEHPDSVQRQGILGRHREHRLAIGLLGRVRIHRPIDKHPLVRHANAPDRLGQRRARAARGRRPSPGPLGGPAGIP